MKTITVAILLSGVALTSAGAARADGYWKLDRTEFVNEAGAADWMGQAETRIQLLAHDSAQFAFRESWRTSMTQTYAVRWRVPDRLIPGEVAPFDLAETCSESSISPGWPFANTKMSPASLVADFDRGSYYQLGDTPCTVGATVHAPAPSWKVPSGKLGDTTKVVVSAVPTYRFSVIQRFFYSWTGGAPPVAGTAPPAANTTAPTQRQGERSSWTPPANLTGAEPLGAPPDPVIVRNGADGGVTAGATRPATFDLAAPYLVTQIMTYHYGSRGRPGTIALRHEDGTLYGPWQAAGAGSRSAPNVYWWVRPNVVLKPGRYTVIDSEPASWSREAATAGAGIMQIWGRRP